MSKTRRSIDFLFYSQILNFQKINRKKRNGKCVYGDDCLLFLRTFSWMFFLEGIVFRYSRHQYIRRVNTLGFFLLLNLNLILDVIWEPTKRKQKPKSTRNSFELYKCTEIQFQNWVLYIIRVECSTTSYTFVARRGYKFLHQIRMYIPTSITYTIP